MASWRHVVIACALSSVRLAGRREAPSDKEGSGRRRSDGACKIGDRGLASIGIKIEKI